MKFWTVSEFSKITNLTKRTLHYYDDEGILTAHHRNEAGYRFYSQHELQRIHQIEMLKYIGYDLKDIKQILTDSSFNWTASLKLQLVMFENQISQYQCAINFIRKSIDSYAQDNMVNLELLVQMYHFSNIATNGKYREWLIKHFTSEEIEFLINIVNQASNLEHVQQSKARFAKAKSVMHLPYDDPHAQEIARELRQPLSNYGENIHLRNKVWELMKQGDIPYGLIPGYEQGIVIFVSKVIELLDKKSS